MTLVEHLALLLRPAGGGVHLVSTGKAEQEALQRRPYGAGTAAEVQDRWRADLAQVATARAVLLGIPSDAGGGLQRGANLGPAAIRAQLLEDDPGLPGRLAAAMVPPCSLTSSWTSARPMPKPPSERSMVQSN